MGDEDRDRPLPQRVRGATRAGLSPSSPALSEELRQRMQAAVTAERSGAAAGGHAEERDSAAGGEVTAPAVESGIENASARGAVKRGVAPPPRITQPERTGQDGRPVSAGPFAEDEITEWLGTSVGTRPAAKPGSPGAVEPAPAMRRSAGLERADRSRTWLAVLVAAAVVIGSLAVVTVRHFTRSPGSPEASAAMLQEEAVRDQAAAWVVQQVSRSATVSCDPVMCTALTAHGFPSRNVLALGPTSPAPPKSAVVVETSAVLALFGSSLATAWAPAILASFGSGPTAITVRVIAPHGAAAYLIALNADTTARKKSGAALLNDDQIQVSTTAREQLTSGQVDPRLVLAIAALAGHQPISILDFGNTGPGVDADLPLRFADLAESDQVSHLGSAAYVRSVRSYLSTVDAQYRPARTETVVTGGQAVLRVEFTAPSPLGVFGVWGFP